MSSTMTLNVNGAPTQPRGNALRHGLSGAGVVLPEHLRLQVDRRRIAYARLFPPQTQRDVDDIELAALGWARFLESRSEMTHRAVLRSEMAVGKWALLRHIDAQERARRLGHNPPSVVAKLKTSLGGVRWMLDEWRMLKDALVSSKDGTWTLKQQERANNLAGVDRIYRENDPHRLKTGTVEDRQRFVEERMSELNELLGDGELQRLDEIDRRATMNGTHALLDPTHDRLKLYEHRAYRMYERAIERLQARHRGVDPESTTTDGKPLDPRTIEEFEAGVDREIAREHGKMAAIEPEVDRAVAEVPASPLAAYRDQERIDVRAAFAERLKSPEIQARVTDEEMALLDDEARDEFRSVVDQLVTWIDPETAIRGMIGHTRMQAEEYGEEDPNRELFERLRREAGKAQADRGRRATDRDLKRRRKAIQAARKRNRGR